jgi:Mg2+/Co2+ transporter CorB
MSHMPSLLLAQAQQPLSHESTVTIALLVVILGALVAVSVAWGAAITRISRLEKDQDESKADRKELREDVSQDRAEVSAVRATLGSILSRLDDLNRTLQASTRTKAG